MLDENQRKALTEHLCELETKLNEIKRDLTRSPDDAASVIFSSEQDVGDGARKAILESATRIVKELRQIKETYQLIPEAESSRRRLYGILLEIRTTLHDMSSENFRGFGDFPQGDAVALDSFVSRVNTIIDEMYRSL